MSIVRQAWRAGLGRTLERVRAGTDRLASHKLEIDASAARIQVSSPLLRQGGALPRSASVDGEALPPPLRWQGVPPSARSTVVLCEDRDAPLPQPFVHWIVYGLPSTIQSLERTAAGHPEGLNSKLRMGYAGASPLVGHGEHHYHFQVFALEVTIDLAPGAGRTALLEAMRGHVVAWGELVGTYEHT